jgi:flagellar biosynthesis activator protein FlaF
LEKAMYSFAYDAIFDNVSQTPAVPRRPRIEDALELLEAAAAADTPPHQVQEALSHMHQLWPGIIEDMCGPEHDLPPSSRAGLISIGRFVLEEVEQVWFGKQASLQSLIAITDALSEKLA